MAGRKKRVLETAAPGVTETGASASVSVNDPVEPKNDNDIPSVIASAGDAGDAGDAGITVISHGHRRFEPLTRTVMPAGIETRITSEDMAQVRSNIDQLNHLAGFKAIEILE
jgi:hypothetical protein